MSLPPLPLPPLVAPAAHLTAAELRRYGRHLAIPALSVTGQKRLKNARVLCVGAGGLGSPALMYLAAAGIGTLGIVEFDTVDESNLQRQVIHHSSDIGRSKAQSAAESVKGINPLIDVVIHELVLNAENACTLFDQYDLIVDGTDNFATRYIINDAAALLGKPYVWGSVHQFTGQASVFWAKHGPCYRCLYPEPPPPGEAPSCTEGGVLGALCASIGAIQVTEAIKVLTGIGTPLLGRLITYDALRMEYRTVHFHKDPACARCGPHSTSTGLVGEAAFSGTAGSTITPTVTAVELAQWRETGEDFLLVDVREPAEHQHVRISGSTLIPVGNILSGAALADLPRNNRIVLYCRSGVRSEQALSALQTAGFTDLVHLEGGILSWIENVEPSLPAY